MHQRRNFRLTKPLSVINLFKLRPSNLTAADANTANDGTDTEDSETVRASVRRPPFASLSPCLLSRSRLRAESSVGTHTAHRHLPPSPSAAPSFSAVSPRSAPANTSRAPLPGARVSLVSPPGRSLSPSHLARHAITLARLAPSS